MRFLKILQIIFIVICFLQLKPSYATLIELGDDGSINTFEASDYLQDQRRKKHPYSANYSIKSPNHKIYYDKIISKMSEKYNVDFNLIKAIIAVESSYNQEAVSPVGAQGLMQLMPMTSKRFNVSNPLSPLENIEGGTQYLSYLTKLYDGEIELILAAYNAGEGAVKKHKGIPPYPETIDYIPKVINAYNQLNNL